MSKLISTYPIDEEFLNEDKYLRELSIGCDISSLKNIPDLSNLTELVTFYLIRNQITSLEGIEVLNSLEKLEELYISGNKLTTLEGFEKLDGCKQLRKIDLSNNKITDLCDFEPLSHLINLKSIDLSHNQITNLNITHKVPTLTSLNLSYNQISQITALKNLPNLEVLTLFDNKIEKLENLENLPKLETIHIEGNPVRAISGLENLPRIQRVKDISTLNLTNEEIENIANYIEKIDLELEDDDGPEDLELLLTIYGPYPRKVFKVNDFITLKLRYYRHDNKFKTFLYVDGQKFNQCSFVLLQIPKDRTESLEEIDSIDEAIELLDKSLEYTSPPIRLQITPEEEFWGHCSNIQVWVENHYDTRLLHRNMAFPLLRRLTQLGDPVAKIVFKEEIAKRYSSGVPSVIEFLKKEGYLTLLSKDELSAISTKHQD